MCKIKTLIISSVCCLLAFVIAVSAATKKSSTLNFAVPDTTSVEIDSIRHTKVENGTIVENRFNLDGFEKKIENSNIEVWFDEDAASVRLLNKSTGYIWGGLHDGGRGDMNKKWTRFANSICTIEYYDENDKEQRVSISDNTSVDATYDWQGDSLICDLYLYNAEITLSFKMTLYDDSLLFEVVKGSFKEEGTCRIKSLTNIWFGCFC